MTIAGAFSPMGGIKDRGFRYTTEVPEDNYTLECPLGQSGNYAEPLDIDWGDGTVTTQSVGTFPTHTYATAGDYKITLKSGTGKIPEVAFNGAGSHPTPAALIKDIDYLFCTWTSNSYGGSGGTQGVATRLNYMFRQCSQLSCEFPKHMLENQPNLYMIAHSFRNTAWTGPIPPRMFENNVALQTITNGFNGAQFTGSIPEDIFANNKRLKELYGIFVDATRLTGSIPAGLFRNQTELTYLGSAFYNNQGLSGTIPPNLFANCTKLTSLTSTFYNCKNLTGTIPADLFANCPNIQDLNNVFNLCTNITTIPTGLFRNNSKVTSFYRCFRNSGVTNIPSGLFDGMTVATNFGELFYNCKSLIGPIPSGLFDDATSATSFTAAFDSCNNLEGTIPAGLFAGKSNVTNFGTVFNGCAKLTGTIPADLFDGCTAAKNFNATFSSSGVTGLSAGLFSDCTDAEDFTSCFYQCRSLAGSIPAGFFAGLSKATSFYATFNVTALSGTIPHDLFDGCSAATSFSLCFYYLSGLTGEIPADLFEDCVNAKHFLGTFQGCSNLTSAPANLFSNTAGYNYRMTFCYCTKLKMSPDVFGTNYSARFANIEEPATFRQFFFLNATPNPPQAGTAPDVWDTTKWTYASGMEPGLTDDTVTTSNRAFRGQTASSLTNYASIPSTWK